MAAIHICTNLFHGIKIQRLLIIIITFIIPILIVSHCYIMTLQTVTSLNHSEISGFQQLHFTYANETTDYIVEKKGERGFGSTSDAAKNMIYDNDVNKEVNLDNYKRVSMSETKNHISIVSNRSQELIVDQRNSDLSYVRNISSVPEDDFNRTEQRKNVSISLDGLGKYDMISILKSLEKPSISLSQMNTLLSLSHNSSCLKKPQCHWSSPRDRELLRARFKIEKASATVNSPGIATSVFRNVSMFKRSYELMEKMLKVYIYKEGEKPIFHQPQMRGIYASEGWFMKLMKESEKFVTRDPNKAHLFYLPFSSKLLRTVLSQQNSTNRNNLEEHLGNYVDLIRTNHQFWNRTGGADHFLVACHDWALKLTRNHMKNCIRALCNANAGKGFQIGKDTSLPATNIDLKKDPDISITTVPKSPSERTTLAFFAGRMHGHLRPILFHFWENKEPDMKIFGPMPRDIEGERTYREHMKSSKYCICARGHEVYTPRVVEAILNTCIPVFISDNYVPPFFEVLNWESFSIFVQEKEISNLRNILLSVPEKDYLSMYARLKIVQKHFIWHKIPLKYDLFHMILHSVWYNRVFQMKTNRIIASYSRVGKPMNKRTVK